MQCPLLDDFTLLAITVWGEARGESAQGKLAVAWVIHNRMIEEEDDISGIVLKAYQFSFWNTEDPSRPNISTIGGGDPIWFDCCKAAAGAHFELVPDPTYGATLYYNPSVCTPNWNFSE